MGNGRPIPPLAFDRLPAWTRTYEAGHPAKPWVTRPQDQFYFRQLDTNATAEEGLVRYLPIQHSGLKLRKAIATIPEHDLYTQWWR